MLPEVSPEPVAGSMLVMSEPCRSTNRVPPNVKLHDPPTMGSLEPCVRSTASLIGNTSVLVLSLIHI